MDLVSLSVRRPVAIGMLVVAMVIFGAVSFTRLPVNLLPEISYPTLTVETRYPGAAPAEVESLVTRPIEEAVGILAGVRRLTSRSRSGLSQVTLEFGWDDNMDLATLDAREKLDLVTLPRDVDKPRLLRFDPSTDPILRLGLTGSDDLAELRRIAEDLDSRGREVDALDVWREAQAIDPGHPAMAAFPTQRHTNWQWWELVHGAAAMTNLVLDYLATAKK